MSIFSVFSQKYEKLLIYISFLYEPLPDVSRYHVPLPALSQPGTALVCPLRLGAINSGRLCPIFLAYFFSTHFPNVYIPQSIFEKLFFEIFSQKIRRVGVGDLHPDVVVVEG